MKLFLVLRILAAVLVVGCASSSRRAENPSPALKRYHQVRPGETLFGIAEKYQVDPLELLLSNSSIDPDAPPVGAQIFLPHDIAKLRGFDLSVSRKAQQALLQGGTGAVPSFDWPVKSPLVTSLYGWRRGRPHEGIDLRAPKGTPVLAAADGIVKVRRKIRGYGYVIILDHGAGWTTVYAHLSRFRVKRGVRVKRGKLVANSGATGRAFGAHLHFEIRHEGQSLDPTLFLKTATVSPDPSIEE